MLLILFLVAILLSFSIVSRNLLFVHHGLGERVEITVLLRCDQPYFFHEEVIEV